MAREPQFQYPPNRGSSASTTPTVTSMGVNSHVDTLLENPITWQLKLCGTPCETPGPFWFGCVCTPCAAYKQRLKLIEVSKESIPKHSFCLVEGALFDCCNCIDRPWCHIVESGLCPHMVVMSNRRVLLDHHEFPKTTCDECLDNLQFCCILCAGICVEPSCDTADCNPIGACFTILVCGCMYAQQQAQLQEMESDSNENPRSSAPPQHRMSQEAPQQRTSQEPPQQRMSQEPPQQRISQEVELHSKSTANAV